MPSVNPNDPQPETELQKLLRLKRHEQPPEGYFEDFLTEFQRRQRAEMLREPIWRIALDRLGAFFTDYRPAQLSYGVATLCVIGMAGFALVGIFSNSPENQFSRPSLAAVTAAPEASPSAPPTMLSLAPSRPDLEIASKGSGRVLPASLGNARPHYVMDARPASYEPPFNF